MRCLTLTLATALLFALPLPASAQEAERIELEISEETTFFTEPVTEDGLIDYVAALNAYYGEGMSNEDNAFLFLVPLFSWEESVAEQWDRLYAELSFSPDPNKPRLVDWFEYADEQGIDLDRADEIYNAAHQQPWVSEDYPLLSGWLELNEPVFQELLQLTSYDKYYSPLVREESGQAILDVRLPQLLLIRNLARGLLIHAQEAIGRGDIEAAMNDIIVLHRFGVLVSNEATHIGKLVGLSILTLEHSAILSLAGSGGCSHELTQAYLASTGLAVSYESIASHLGTGDRCMLLDLVIRSSFGMRPNWEYLWFSDNVPPTVEKYAETAELEDFDLDRSLRTINPFFTELSRIAEIEDYEERLSLLESIDEQLADKQAPFPFELMLQMLVGEAPIDSLSPILTDSTTNLYCKVMLHRAMNAIRIEQVSIARNRVHSTAIALLGYRDAHGELPESLEALVPVYFEDVPMDPYSEAPLVYRIADDGSALVYSIGDNFEDNDGVDDYSDGDIAIRIGPPPAESD